MATGATGAAAPSSTVGVAAVGPWAVGGSVETTPPSDTWSLHVAPSQ